MCLPTHPPTNPLPSKHINTPPISRKNELPGIAQWMVEQRHKRIYAEDVLRLNAEARNPASTGDTPLMCLAL